ncbi:predicted protein [Uncinocarpus reesii 1704]|uniref:Zona occludens toxin N-terminal domain-containing protein n=1 Tax=Uncinocarpus reesii (strain UAMH 1704) TaxID=336963 RepID=C4JWS9_UNCRE|nr:uncharacterized protein UREG_06102 [Uncinocarpus reesii 1704]EEP81237.1 predicted protein [Uncinocarpus reesii 1704]
MSAIQTQQGHQDGWFAELEAELKAHLTLVDGNSASTEQAARNKTREQLRTAPIHSAKVRAAFGKNRAMQENEFIEADIDAFPQYGLIGKRLATYGYGSENIQTGEAEDDLIYTNTNAPWSAFICGSQGSAKSHTLSCMLENALLAPSQTGKLAAPLTGLVLHYDRFSGFEAGQPCEAAYVCSSGIPVRVLVSPSNYQHMKSLYENLEGLSDGSPKPVVSKLKFAEKHLNITMMKALMAVDGEGQEPLYMEVVTQILREMAQEYESSRINYHEFKCKLDRQILAPNQRSPLALRMSLLESFLEVEEQRPKRRGQSAIKGNAEVDKMWSFEKGSLTIVDLSCPFVGANDACALFNICLSNFLAARGEGNRLVALDEAHKFLTTTGREAIELTENLLTIIRQQRHLGTRVIIATQEPTLSPKLLDLCDVTVVHRFSSPEWYKTLEGHLAGAVVGATEEERSRFSRNSIFQDCLA